MRMRGEGYILVFCAVGCGTKDFTVRTFAVRLQAKRGLVRVEEVMQPSSRQSWLEPNISISS